MCESGRPMTIEERLDNHYKIIKDEQRRLDELDARVKALEQAKGSGSTLRGCMFPLDGFPPKPEKIRPMNFYDHLNTPHTKEAKPTPTDEAEKLISEYLFLFNARFDMDVKDSEDVRDILRRLIAEVRS